MVSSLCTLIGRLLFVMLSWISQVSIPDKQVPILWAQNVRKMVNYTMTCDGSGHFGWLRTVQIQGESLLNDGTAIVPCLVN